MLHVVLDRLSPEGTAVLTQGLVLRAEKGKKDYGRFLETHNGRSALVDLYQELLDAMMYLAQIQLETPTRWSVRHMGMSAMFVALSFSAVWVRKILDREPVSYGQEG